MSESNTIPKICLNMIVKNESKVIERLLNSVLPLVDYYCICDTGSTDNTEEIIREFFAKHMIPGVIVKEPFQDFGYNRTFALQQCDQMTKADYILLMDADMILEFPSGNFPKKIHEIKKKLWEHPAHYLFQGSPKFHYKNVRFVKNKYGMTYWGVTHEYVKVPEGTVYGMFDRNDIFINDVGDGGSKADKFERDIRLLTAGLEKEPNNDRYTFYLANSLRDAGRTDEAIETFKKRIKIGGWIEEIWFSSYSIGKCYRKLDNMPAAIYHWMDGYNAYPRRIENLYQIINYYREQGKNELAYQYFRIADRQRNENPNQDFLFMEKDIYDYKLDYELTILGYYCNHDGYDLPKYCVKVMCYPHLEEWTSRNILSNYKFYAPELKSMSNVVITDTIDDCINLVSDSNFNKSTPSIVLHNDKEIINIRHVNYHIDDKGGYVQKENVETRNVLFLKDTSTTMLISHNTDLDENNMYIGLEDVRIFSYKNRLFYNANRGLGYSKFQIEHGEIDMKTGITVNSRLVYYEQQTDVEKNWVLFEDSYGNMKCIYSWHPLIIGDIYSKVGSDTEPNFLVSNRVDTPNCFRHFRGSTNGVNVNGEIWFICHIVSYEDRRYYYHVLVALDPKTYKMKRFSKFFTFEKEKVEYTLGFIYNKSQDQIKIGYSLLDSCTKFLEIPRAQLEELFLEPF